MNRRVIVVGGGAAGMMAAIFAARKGVDVVIVERNEKLGKKIYITGKGRCNVTNHCQRDAFIQKVVRNGQFLYSALSFFSPEDLINLLEQAKCPLITERGGRVFPVSSRASDITKALAYKIRETGVRIRYNSRVTGIVLSSGGVTGIVLQSGEMMGADAVIVATGGVSYPLTGSTGDGYAFLRQAGHTIIQPAPALSALITNEQWPCYLQGLSLKNITLTVWRHKKRIYHSLGELLFTHFGLSGPIVLEASSYLDPYKLQDYTLTIDLKPGLSFEQLEARMLREFLSAPGKQLTTLLHKMLPGKLAKVFPYIMDVNAEQPANHITRETRALLLHALKELPLSVRAFRPIEEAIITRGGVSIKEVDPKNMESKLISGLYAAGEVLDIDAHTGGYNLQIAFSTGALAGQCAAVKHVCPQSSKDGS